MIKPDHTHDPDNICKICFMLGVEMAIETLTDEIICEENGWLSHRLELAIEEINKVTVSFMDDK